MKKLMLAYALEIEFNFKAKKSYVLVGESLKKCLAGRKDALKCNKYIKKARVVLVECKNGDIKKVFSRTLLRNMLLVESGKEVKVSRLQGRNKFENYQNVANNLNSFGCVYAKAIKTIHNNNKIFECEIIVNSFDSDLRKVG